MTKDDMVSFLLLIRGHLLDFYSQDPVDEDNANIAKLDEIIKYMETLQ